MGKTPIPYNSSVVSRSKIPTGGKQAVIHTANVIVHEVGHQGGTRDPTSRRSRRSRSRLDHGHT